MPSSSPKTEAPRPQATRQPQQQNQDQGFFAKYGRSIIQMVAIWLLMRWLTSGLQKPPTPEPTTTQPGPASMAGNEDATRVSTSLAEFDIPVPEGVYYSPYRPMIPLESLPNTFVPLWQKGTPMDLDIYANEDEYFVDYHASPVWQAKDITLGDAADRREHKVWIPTTHSLQHNGTLYAHIFLRRKHMPINPENPSFIPDAVVYLRHTLTKFYPKKASVKERNLLHRKDEDDHEEDQQDDEPTHEEEVQEDTSTGKSLLASGLLANITRRAPLVAYWHENVTLSIITDSKTVIPKNTLQPPVLKHIPFDTGLTRDETGKVGFYRPIIYPNDFWLLQQNAYPVNSTVSVLPLTIHLEPLSMWKFNIYASFDESMKQQANSAFGGMSSGEMDEVKRMFMETNPILLGTTICVSLLHSLFEMLAFKNDITFWKKKDNSAGVSVRSILVNIFFQIVIFLYLMDNNQETSWMILIGQGFGLLIEIWKVFKALKYELTWTRGSLLPSLRSQPVQNTQEEDETAKYDAIAFKYLMWVSYPLLFGYAVYSLLYDEHKGWYSFVLKTLVEFVYMFGFITMLPQLYINYRLKSVAHMPWKTLMYKSLNTFIDDLFAFVIKMPTLHRIACLRDDAVFVIYIYQRYIYKVDPTRANEYGQVGQDTSKDETKQKEITDGTSSETKKTQ
ncbi:cleft lip and palate transmembrane protein 1-domain-containing protein [Radiomyces spectabilis]|uniref:cleft lip and palate transmembrane protein 1-domain-containing protein n=1 Tax=Radiomyces spectabilis TaxID=64574 RepID=UPI00221E638A|nr:cleft lip and palate transmembrane protein 1-domain-containing protein [Radiomyces spectabilis]KAI8381330.1 cleft lip and palate transmembrane protein 1-domain-containing protein [Radiomyces spectabilis]